MVGIMEIMKQKSALIVISAIFAAFVVWALITDAKPLWALILGVIGFVLAVAYMRGARPFGQKTLIVLVAWVLFLSLAACAGGTYTNQTGQVPPNVVGIRFVHQGEDMECGIGLTQDAVSGVVSAFAPPVGFVAWMAWSVTDGDGTVSDLKDCWDTSQANWREIELATQCWGQPALKSTWTDWGKATAFVQIPFCQCNLACQGEMNQIAAGWNWLQMQCRLLLFVPCGAFGGNSANMAQTEGTLTTETLEPLPPDFATPAWDTTAPAPPHPVNCLQPDCSDILPN